MLRGFHIFSLLFDYDFYEKSHFVDLKSNSALLSNKGHNFKKVFLTLNKFNKLTSLLKKEIKLLG